MWFGFTLRSYILSESRPMNASLASKSSEITLVGDVEDPPRNGDHKGHGEQQQNPKWQTDINHSAG